MITAVRLENWRAYRSFKLSLEPGTTFLVAPNGVGKTSFIEAVQWALDPDAKPKKAFMRRRAKKTTVEVELLAGEAKVRIKRTLTLGRGKAPAASVDAWIANEHVDATVVWRLLADAWKADNNFASRAAFISDRFIDRNREPDLRAHLTRLHALDHVQAAVSSLSTLMTAATAEADSVRKTTNAGEAELQQLVENARRATELLEAAVANSETLRAAAVSANNTLAEAQRSNEIHAARQKWLAERTRIASEASSLLDAALEQGDLRSILRTAEAAARQQLIELTERRAKLSERLAAVEESLHQLHEAGGVCPVCRRPLDDASRHYAEEQHELDRSVVRDQVAALEADAPETLASELRRLLARADALGDPPPEPAGESIDLIPLHANVAASNAAFEKTLEELGRAQRTATEADERVATIKADQEGRSSVLLYARVAALETAKLALEATVTRVLDAQVGPVSQEVNRRWEAVFPDRPGLRVDASGHITRTFDDDEDDLDFDSFSSGEQVVAKLLMRLATLTSTTEVPFCLIDEPLEHLDPDARSYVARTLAYLGSGDGLRQIFVTTYEQELALQLAGRGRDQIQLEFLRTAHVSA
jgi:DNA repair exonuclease SbcCD ATPase subunit